MKNHPSPYQWIPPTRGLLLVILALLLGLTACQSGTVASAAVSVATATAVPPTPTLPPPAITSATTAMPSFAPIDPDAIETVTPIPSATEPAAAAPPTKEPTTSPTETASPTLQPTFTPPALPLTSLDEHYWLRRPIPEGGVVWTDKTYPYGSTRGGTLRPHHGVEFYVPTGTQVLAAASGTVLVANTDLEIIYGPHTNFYGNLIVIELDSRWNGQPVYNLYAHLSELQVSEGQHIDAQQPIALSGATGVADGAHLHFEVRMGQNSYNTTYNPLLWLWPYPNHGTVAGRITHPNGQLAYEAPVRAVRIDAPSAYAATTTYADNSLNADTTFNENFAIDDLEAGYYEIIVDTGNQKYKEEVWVYARRTSFVEIILGE